MNQKLAEQKAKAAAEKAAKEAPYRDKLRKFEEDLAEFILNHPEVESPGANSILYDAKLLAIKVSKILLNA